MTDPWLVVKQMADVWSAREEAYKKQLATIPAATPSQASTSTNNDQSAIANLQATLASHDTALEAIHAALRKQEEATEAQQKNLEQLRAYVEDALKPVRDAQGNCPKVALPSDQSHLINRIESIEHSLADGGGLEKKLNTMQRAMSTQTKADEDARKSVKASLSKLESGVKAVKVRVGKVEVMQKKYEDQLKAHSETTASSLRSIRFELEMQKEALEEIEDCKLSPDGTHGCCKRSTSTMRATESLTDVEEEKDFLALIDGLLFKGVNEGAEPKKIHEENENTDALRESAGAHVPNMTVHEGEADGEPSKKSASRSYPLQPKMAESGSIEKDRPPTQSMKMIHPLPEKPFLDRIPCPIVNKSKRKSTEAHEAVAHPSKGFPSQRAISLSPDLADVEGHASLCAPPLAASFTFGDPHRQSRPPTEESRNAS